MRGSSASEALGPDPDPAPDLADAGAAEGRSHAGSGGDDVVPVLVVSAVLLATYGYEIFSFSLTMDEPVLGLLGQRGLLNTWVAGGRWGMGLVSAVMPPMVVPSLAAALGVSLTAAGVWRLARRMHGLQPWPSAALTALCVSLPMILLHLSFMTNAIGVGVGFLLTSLVAERVERQRGLLDAAALVMTAFVLAVYEAFGLVLLAVALGMLLRAPQVVLARRWAALLGVSFVVSKVVGLTVRAVVGVSTSDYSSSMLDLGGLAADPWGRAVRGASRAYGVLGPGGGVFDPGMPWLGLLLVALLVGAVGGVVILGGTRTERAVRWVALVSLLAVPLAAGVLVDDLPLRSMLYLPAVIISLAAVVLTTERLSVMVGRSWPAVAIGAAVSLAVVANMSVGNRALASAEVALVHDRHVAMRIDEERRRLLPAQSGPVAVYVTPVERWPDSTVTPGLEHLGLSQFSGETWRASSFLASHGVPVARLTAQQEESAVALAAALPVYPQAGWARVDDGVLVVRLR